MSEMIKQSKGFFWTAFTIAAGVILCFIVYYGLTGPDKRTNPEKIDDAVGELYKGANKAGRQLKDRTPPEKLNDAAKDLKKDLNQP